MLLTRLPQAQRISQKLLRNIQKFLELIYLELNCQRMKEIRINMEEIVLQGTDCELDVRTVNSYPSKVATAPWSPHAKFQCSARIVSTLHRPATCEHRSKCSVSRFSADSCNASSPSG